MMTSMEITDETNNNTSTDGDGGVGGGGNSDLRPSPQSPTTGDDVNVDVDAPAIAIPPESNTTAVPTEVVEDEAPTQQQQQKQQPGTDHDDHHHDNNNDGGNDDDDDDDDYDDGPEGCYLTFESSSGGRLMLVYSRGIIPRNAVGFWCPGPDHTIQGFKFKQAGGKSELIKGIAGGDQNRRKYFSGWCQFIKQAKAMNGYVRSLFRSSLSENWRLMLFLFYS